MRNEMFRKNSNGWYFRMRVRDSQGNSRIKRFSGFPTKKDAQNAYEEIKRASKEGKLVFPIKKLFGEIITEWFDLVYKWEVEKTTAQSRWYSIKKHLVPTFGKMTVDQITSRMLRNFYRKKLEEGLSAKSVQLYHSLMKQILDYAIEENYIDKNPAYGIKPPSHRYKKRNVWTVEETKKFLKTIEGTKYEAFYITAIFTGMRRGELLGLKWSDIDFEKRKINIQRNLARISGEGLILKGLKTQHSYRQISISPYVVDILHKHQKSQEQLKKHLGEEYVDHGLVFCSDNGNLRDPRNLLREFHELIKKAGVPHCTIHDLRHLHATLLLRDEINPKIVQERLGHNNVKVTLDIYSHVTPDLQEEAALNLEKSFFNSFEH